MVDISQIIHIFPRIKIKVNQFLEESSYKDDLWYFGKLSVRALV